MGALLSPTEVIETLAAAYFDKLHEGDASPPWEALPDCRKERHRRAVRAVLLRHGEVMEQQRQQERATKQSHAPFSFVREDLGRIGARPDDGGGRRFTEKLKQRAG